MKIGFCTIASANYLSRVQVLEQSLKSFHPNAEFHILLCETIEVCNKISAETGREFIAPDSVGCTSYKSMAFYYDITEFNTALKPFLLETLLDRGYEAVIYLDPDIEVYGNLSHIFDLLTTYDSVLTPHVCFPVPDDGKRPTMDAYIRAGQFNLGFIGISASPEIRELLVWWKSVLIDRCLFDENNQFFVDQFWAAAIPSLLEKTYILRDPAYNMAYWNVFQRKLSMEEGKWRTDSGELKFFHFSGLYRQDLTKVSVHQNRVSAPVGSPLFSLLTEYFAKIQSQQWSKYSDFLYSYGCYSNGEPITCDERKTYLGMMGQGRPGIDNPFDANNFPKNIIRINCKEKFDLNYEQTDPKSQSIRIKQLQQEIINLRNSLSWRITDPIRKIHSKLTTKRKS